jgi:hypothetical protein
MNDDFRRLLLLLLVDVVVAVDMQAVMELQRWMMMGLCAAAAGAELQNKLGAENCEIWMEKEDLDET